MDLFYKLITFYSIEQRNQKEVQAQIEIASTPILVCAKQVESIIKISTEK